MTVVDVPTYPSLPVLDHLDRQSPGRLGDLATVLATRADLWRPLLHVDPVHRWSTRFAGGEGWEAWLLTWLPGQRTGLHDHGGGSGAFVVLEGLVREETALDRHGRVLQPGALRSWSARHVHDLVGDGYGPAATLHVYSPRMTRGRRYERTGAGTRLVPIGRD